MLPCRALGKFVHFAFLDYLKSTRSPGVDRLWYMNCTVTQVWKIICCYITEIIPCEWTTLEWNMLDNSLQHSLTVMRQLTLSWRSQHNMFLFYNLKTPSLLWFLFAESVMNLQEVPIWRGVRFFHPKIRACRMTSQTASQHNWNIRLHACVCCGSVS